LHTLLGEIHFSRKRNKQAEAAFLTALECDREYWRAHNGLGLLLWLRGDNEQAREHLEQAISLEPRSDVAHVNLGQVLVGLGQLAEAEALYRRALEINPNLAVTHYRLGQLYERRRQTEKAISAYQKSAEILQGMPSGQARNLVGFKNSIEKRLRATLRKHNLSTLLWVVVPYSLVLVIALIPKVRMDRSCARDKQARLQELLKKEWEWERCLTGQLAMHQKKLRHAIPRS
jgi:tetratricopeptide (TPR) repeat protein